MRIASLLVLLAACAHTPDRSGPPGEVTCTTSLSDYCATNSCDRTLAAAEQDSNLCPAMVTRCGRYEVIEQTSIDVVTSWYYEAGNLVAVINRVLPGPTTCLAGPATFALPRCTAPARRLPVCGS